MSSNSKQRSRRDRSPDEGETDEPDHHHHHHHHQQQQDDEKQDESPQSKVRTTTFHGNDWRCSSVRKKKYKRTEFRQQMVYGKKILPYPSILLDSVINGIYCHVKSIQESIHFIDMRMKVQDSMLLVLSLNVCTHVLCPVSL